MKTKNTCLTLALITAGVVTPVYAQTVAPPRMRVVCNANCNKCRPRHKNHRLVLPCRKRRARKWHRVVCV